MIRFDITVAIGAACCIPGAAQQQRTKITSPVLCGTVTDLSGAPIAKAKVAAMWADFGTSMPTDELGRWSFGKGSGPHWMQVEADGFESFIFDYVDEADPNDTGANKPAFIVQPKDKSCPAPIHVRLAPKGSQAGSVNLEDGKS